MPTKKLEKHDKNPSVLFLKMEPVKFFSTSLIQLSTRCIAR